MLIKRFICRPSVLLSGTAMLVAAADVSPAAPPASRPLTRYAATQPMIPPAEETFGFEPEAPVPRRQNLPTTDPELPPPLGQPATPWSVPLEQWQPPSVMPGETQALPVPGETWVEPGAPRILSVSPPAVSQPLPAVPMHVPSPPPGTLGQTYSRRSALIPADMHPRIAMVDVHGLPQEAKVEAEGMHVDWGGKFWRLESKDPLMPGLPHVLRIKAAYVRNGQNVTESRTVRMIMGRIVDVEF